MSSATTSGTLSRYPLPRLLVFILRKGFTGALELELPKGTVKTFFTNGWPEFSDLVSPPDLLSQILVEQGLITSEQQDLSLKELAERKELHGRILMKLGFLSQEQLISGLKLQLHRKLVRLFQFEEAPFKLTLERSPDHLQPELDKVYADPVPVVVHGLRSHYSYERLTDEMAGLDDMAFRLQVEDKETLDRVPKEPGDNKALALLGESYWNLEDLLAANQSTRLPVTGLVYALWAIGLLDVTEADNVPRRRPKQARRFTPKTTQELKAMATRASSDTDMDSLPDDPDTPVPRVVETPGAVILPPLPEGTSEQAARVYMELRERLEVVDRQNLFQILGVPNTATRQQVKEAYLVLAKKFHPDRVAAMDLEVVRGHTDRLFQRISEAFTTLLDDKKRQEYLRIVEDKTLGGGRDRARQVLESEVHFQKGEVYFRKGDLENAQKMFQTAVDGNPDEGEHHAMLAWTLYYKVQRGKGETDSAEIKKMLRHAIELSPRCARAHFYLGKILQTEGMQDDALSCFQKAVDIKPNYLEPAREINVIKMRKARSEKPPKSGFWGKFKKR